MRSLSGPGLFILMATSTAAHAYSTGSAHRDCNGCHSGGQTPAVNVSPANPTVLPGALVPVVVEVSSVGDQGRAGFSLRASAGLLSSAEPGVRLLGGDATHLQPKTALNGVSRFTVQWAAPLSPGTFTLSAYGNAVDGVGGSSGDRAGLATATVRVGSPGDELDAGTPEATPPDGGTGGSTQPAGNSGGMAFGNAPPPPEEPARGCAAAGMSLVPAAALAWLLTSRRRRH